MKNSYYVFLSLLFLFLSFSTSAEPSLEYSEDACGYVLVINRSSCAQTVYCHEISGDNNVYNMGTIAPGAQTTVYPTADQARVWSENAQGEEMVSKNTQCSQNYVVYVDNCVVYTCTAQIVNNGCETLKVYAAVNGNWVVVEQVPVGESINYHIDQPGVALIFAYTYDDVLGTVTAQCGKTYTINDDDCEEDCNVYLTNNACQTVKVYVQYANDWTLVGSISKGSTYTHLTVSAAKYKFLYADGTHVASWTGWCGEAYSIDDTCQSSCPIYFENDACEELYVYLRKSNGTSVLIGRVAVGVTSSHPNAVNGSTYIFKYADNSTVSTWTGWCGEKHVIEDTCHNSCPIYFENDACEELHVYLQKSNGLVFIGKVAVGVTSSHPTAVNGSTYVFKYADGSTVSTWQGWCGEKHVIKDTCSHECDVFFDNDACEDVLVYRRDNHVWKYVGTLDKGVKYKFSTIAGTSFTFKYADGTQIGQWNTWCHETYTIEDDCSSCETHITNNACDKVQVFAQVGYDWKHIGSLDKGKTFKHMTVNGTKYVFRYADGTTIGSWTGWCGESFTINDQCQTKCDVSIKNRACNKLEILANINGTLVSKGFIDVGQTAIIHAFEGIHYILKNPDGTHAGSWTSECGKIYTAYKQCPTECDAYLKNNACEKLFAFKVVDGSSTAVGSAAIGSNLHLSAFEGTTYVFKYADGSVVGEWDLECNKTFTAHQTCTTPCDDVTVTAIKIYDQETDMEVTGIGAISDGATIDGDLLPEEYYITAEVSDATESVTLTVDGWRACENFEPYTFPNAAHEGTNWDGGAGAHSVTVSVSSEADCYSNTCQTVKVDFTITEPTHVDTCTLQASASQSAPTCEGAVTLSASVSGQSTCCDGAQDALCGTRVDYGGYVIDVDAISGCPDGTGIRLWAAGSAAPTFATVDLGDTVTAGNQICIPMFVKHCLNTDSTSASASVFTSLEVDTNFVTLGGAIFQNTEFANFCFDLSSDTRFVKIVDNGQCSFRVDAVQVTPVNCAGNSSVSYYWLNSVGDTISTSSSVAVSQIGDYTLAVQDCAGCISVVEDIIVASTDGEGCSTPAEAGNLALANGDTSIDICIGDGISDAFDVVLTGESGESSVYVVLDPLRNILAILDGPSFELENSADAGLCIICHVSFNGELTGFEVGQNANDVGGDIDFSNEISVTKFTSGGPCGDGGLFASTESRSLNVELSEVVMFPNPVSNTLNLLTNLTPGTSVNVEIFTVDGRSVQRSPMVVEKTNQINVAELSSNQFYLIRVQQGDQGVFVDKFYKSE